MTFGQRRNPRTAKVTFIKATGKKDKIIPGICHIWMNEPEFIILSNIDNRTIFTVKKSEVSSVGYV